MTRTLNPRYGYETGSTAARPMSLRCTIIITQLFLSSWDSRANLELTVLLYPDLPPLLVTIRISPTACPNCMITPLPLYTPSGHLALDTSLDTFCQLSRTLPGLCIVVRHRNSTVETLMAVRTARTRHGVSDDDPQKFEPPR